MTHASPPDLAAGEERARAPFAVVVEPLTLTRSASGAVSGVVYLMSGDQAFPERGWYDFPLVVLTWWANAFHDLASGRSRSVECWFMDGPFLFTVTSARSSAWRVRHVDRRELDRTRAPLEVSSPSSFVRSLADAITAVLDALPPPAAGADSEKLARSRDRLIMVAPGPVATSGPGD